MQISVISKGMTICRYVTHVDILNGIGAHLQVATSEKRVLHLYIEGVNNNTANEDTSLFPLTVQQQSIFVIPPF